MLWHQANYYLVWRFQRYSHGINDLPFCCGNYLLDSDMVRRMLQLLEETKSLVLENRKELLCIKQIVMPPSVDDNYDNAQNWTTPKQTFEELEAFCEQLENRQFRRFTVSWHYFTLWWNNICYTQFTCGASVKHRSNGKTLWQPTDVGLLSGVFRSPAVQLLHWSSSEASYRQVTRIDAFWNLTLVYLAVLIALFQIWKL